MPALVDERVKSQRKFDYVVGTRIRVMRASLGMSQIKLAELAEMSNSQLSRIEAGERSLSFQQACAIAQALHQPLESLVRAPEKKRKRVKAAA